MSSNIFIKSLDKYDTICLSGGGIKAFSFIGSLYYIEKYYNFNINKINKFVGTSAGAIYCYFFSLGYTPSEIKDFILSFNFSKVNSETSITTLLEEYGLIDGSKMTFLLSQFLKNKYDLDDITFDELYKLTNKELYIIGTNYTKNLEKCFSHKHTPNISVLTALRISISIPVVFKPYLLDNDYYIDGAFKNNFPINYCNQDTTLGMYIKYSVNNKLNSVLDLILGSFNILNDSLSEKNNFNNINIITIIDNNSKVENNAQFDLTVEDKLRFIELGITCVKLHIEKFN